MGATGAGAFDSETGRAWLSDRYGPNGASVVEQAIAAVNAKGGSDTLGTREAAEAFAAAEVVATAHGQAPEGQSSADHDAAMRHAGAVRGLDDIVARAQSAVARLGGETSELNASQSRDDDTAADWQAALIDLSNRLDRAERNQP